MEKIILKRTGHVPLTFEGDLLAAASSSDNHASPSYSGSVGRSQKVSIYQTKGGKYVAAIHHSTRWQGEHDTDEAESFASAKECAAWLSGKVPAWLFDDIIDTWGPEGVNEQVDET